MKILYHNLIDDYDPADYSSERANLWATNVKIHHLIVPWRTQTPEMQHYTLDAGLGNTMAADCAAIAGHNLTAESLPFCDRGDCESATPPMVRGETVPATARCTWARDAGWAHAGGFSYKFTKTAAAGQDALAYQTDNADVNDMHGFLPGQTVTRRLFVFIPAASGIQGNEIRISIGDCVGGVFQITSGVPQDIYDVEQEITVTRTLRPNCTGVLIRISTLNTAALNEYFNVDEIEIDKVPAIRIMANDTNVWTAPALSESFTWGAGPMMAFFASTAKRFWRFYLDDPANPDAYIQIGRLGLGVALQMPPIEPGAELPVVSTSQPSTSITGQVFGNRGQLLLAPAFSLPIVSEAERQAILTMFAATHNLDPFFLAVWEDSLDVQAPIYCRIDQERLEFKKTAESGVLWTLDLAFREVT